MIYWKSSMQNNSKYMLKSVVTSPSAAETVGLPNGKGDVEKQEAPSECKVGLIL